MMLPLDVALNEFAQGIRNESQLLDWWDSKESEEHTKIMESLVFFCGQTAPSVKEIEAAIVDSGLSRTSSPVLLIKDNPLLLDIKAPFLCNTDKRQAFLLLFSLFTIADHRRRSQCGPTCGHWWHDL